MADHHKIELKVYPRWRMDDGRLRGSRNFCQRGSNFDNFLLFDERRDDPNITKSGPSSLTLSYALVALRFFRGSGPVLLRNPYFFAIFQGGGMFGPPVPPLDPPMGRNVTEARHRQITNHTYEQFMLCAQSYNVSLKLRQT